MAYDRQTWVDGSDGGTPITAERLNHMEEGIENLDRLDELTDVDFESLTNGDIMRYSGVAWVNVNPLVYFDAAGSAQTVQNNVDAHIEALAAAHDASAILVNDTGNNYTGTDVETVLAELVTKFQIRAAVPASAAAAGVAGTIATDANFIYVCTATNTWKRVAISTW